MRCDMSTAAAIARKNREDAAGVKRQPLHTLTEIAEQIGITASQLGAALKADESAPKMRLNGKSLCFSHKHQWYVMREVRAWWAKRQVQNDIVQLDKSVKELEAKKARLDAKWQDVVYVLVMRDNMDSEVMQ